MGLDLSIRQVGELFTKFSEVDDQMGIASAKI